MRVMRATPGSTPRRKKPRSEPMSTHSGGTSKPTCCTGPARKSWPAVSAASSAARESAHALRRAAASSTSASAPICTSASIALASEAVVARAAMSWLRSEISARPSSLLSSTLTLADFSSKHTELGRLCAIGAATGVLACKAPRAEEKDTRRPAAAAARTLATACSAASLKGCASNSTPASVDGRRCTSTAGTRTTATREMTRCWPGRRASAVEFSANPASMTHGRRTGTSTSASAAATLKGPRSCSGGVAITPGPHEARRACLAPRPLVVARGERGEPAAAGTASEVKTVAGMRSATARPARTRKTSHGSSAELMPSLSLSIAGSVTVGKSSNAGSRMRPPFSVAKDCAACSGPSAAHSRRLASSPLPPRSAHAEKRTCTVGEGAVVVVLAGAGDVAGAGVAARRLYVSASRMSSTMTSRPPICTSIAVSGKSGSRVRCLSGSPGRSLATRLGKAAFTLSLLKER